MTKTPSTSTATTSSSSPPAPEPTQIPTQFSKPKILLAETSKCSPLQATSSLHGKQIILECGWRTVSMWFFSAERLSPFSIYWIPSTFLFLLQKNFFVPDGKTDWLMDFFFTALGGIRLRDLLCSLWNDMMRLRGCIILQSWRTLARRGVHFRRVRGSCRMMMGFEGRKGRKFEVEISAAVRGCERSRGRMVERIIFLWRISLCLVLAFVFWLSCMFCRQMSWLRGMKREVMMCGMDLPWNYLYLHLLGH